MSDAVIVVLADGDEAQIRMLRTKLAGTKIVVGNTSEAFARVAADTTVLCNVSGPLVLFQKVFAMCPKLRWVHSRSVGSSRSQNDLFALFPALIFIL